MNAIRAEIQNSRWTLASRARRLRGRKIAIRLDGQLACAQQRRQRSLLRRLTRVAVHRRGQHTTGVAVLCAAHGSECLRRWLRDVAIATGQLATHGGEDLRGIVGIRVAVTALSRGGGTGMR